MIHLSALCKPKEIHSLILQMITLDCHADIWDWNNRMLWECRYPFILLKHSNIKSAHRELFPGNKHSSLFFIFLWLDGVLLFIYLLDSEAAQLQVSLWKVTNFFLKKDDECPE